MVKPGQRENQEGVEELLERLQRDQPAGNVSASGLPTLGPVEESRTESPSDPALRGAVLRGVKLQVKVELGRVRMPLRKALDLAPGSVVDLEKSSGEPVDILVRGVPIARGHVLVVDDRICVRIGEILPSTREEER